MRQSIQSNSLPQYMKAMEEHGKTKKNQQQVVFNFDLQTTGRSLQLAGPAHAEPVRVEDAI